MQLSLVAVALWIAGSGLQVALIFILVYKRRHRVVPWFTAWMGWHVLYALSCFLAYRFSSNRAYAMVYWVGALIDFMLQIAVIVEIARRVLKPDGSWAEDARQVVLPFVVAGPVIAGLFAAFIKPAADNTLDSFLARASLFSTVLICFLFVSVLRASQRLGLDWRSHLARESLGLTMWTVAAFATDTLHAYWRTTGRFHDLENLRIFISQLVLLYWCIGFWLPGSAPPAMPPTPLRSYTERLQNPES